MNEKSLALLAHIRRHWTLPPSDDVLQIVGREIDNGASIEQSQPFVREMRVVLPRRAETTKRANLDYHGFDELMVNISNLHDDERLVCFYAGSSSYLFAIYFRQQDMSFMGCLHGYKKACNP
jgi:hypothetical protein